jgi:hypothetical protein
VTERYFIKRVPKVAEIIAAQQRRRQLFEDRESRPQHEPQFVADDGISWSAIIEAADRARLAEVGYLARTRPFSWLLAANDRI